MSYSFCTGVSSRCLVELFRKYLFLGPRGSSHWPRFYVQTDPKWEPGSDYWYTNRPVGKNTLEGYIEDMMKGVCGGELQEPLYEEVHLY